MPWTTFRERFLEKYFPQAKKNKRENEFIELVQGNKTVMEYTTQFERLSQFAYYMIDTPEKKNRKYHQGLVSSLCRLTLVHLNQSFEVLVDFATGLEDDGCKEPSKME